MSQADVAELKLPPEEVADLVALWRVFEQCNLGCEFCGYSTRIDRPPCCRGRFLWRRDQLRNRGSEDARRLLLQ